MWLSTFSAHPTKPGQPSCQVVRMPGRKYSSGILTIVILTACQVIHITLIYYLNRTLIYYLDRKLGVRDRCNYSWYNSRAKTRHVGGIVLLTCITQMGTRLHDQIGRDLGGKDAFSLCFKEALKGALTDLCHMNSRVQKPFSCSNSTQLRRTWIWPPYYLYAY